MSENPPGNPPSSGDLLPYRPAVEALDNEPAIIDLNDADSVIGVLSAGTAREILASLYHEPATASDLAERVETSLQNAGYHLCRLRDAGFVSKVDTWYSSRGVAMDVYAPTKAPLLFVAGPQSSIQTLERMVAELDETEFA